MACTPSSTLETLGEIADLLKYNDIKIVKSRVSGFSRAKLEEGRKSESCFEGLIFARFQSVRCADHPRIHSSPRILWLERHPQSDALLIIIVKLVTS